jgi:fused signal recognition particle receptor
MSEQTEGSGAGPAPTATEGDMEQANGTAGGGRRGLFSRIRSRMGDTSDAPEPAPDEAGAGGDPMSATAPTTAEAPSKAAFFGRLKSRLSRTHHGMVDGLADFFEVKRTIDDEALEALETSLLMADVGVDATQSIVGGLAARVSRRELQDLDALMSALQETMEGLLAPVSQPLEIPDSEQPFVVLMVGINGAGKTTTIGKLARRFMAEGRSVMLAAGDTFRAAAVEQLQAWGERNGVPVIAQQTGADSASVIFDAVKAARARDVDVVIADTAGRLHTQSNLMEELRKIHRVVAKLDAAAPHEVMLVVDAGTGQNALAQAVQFNEAVPLTGISLTKLDGTAKGGIIFAIAKRLGVPVRFIGVGETAEDLRVFDANEFVAALLGREPSDRR